MREHQDPRKIKVLKIHTMKVSVRLLKDKMVTECNERTTLPKFIPVRIYFAIAYETYINVLQKHRVNT